MVEDHKVMLHIQYERSRLSGFREDFLRFSKKKDVAILGRGGHNLNKLGRGLIR